MIEHSITPTVEEFRAKIAELEHIVLMCCGHWRKENEKMKRALKKHQCPDDGSTDTVCYPNNHKCPARRLAREK